MQFVHATISEPARHHYPESLLMCARRLWGTMCGVDLRDPTTITATSPLSRCRHRRRLPRAPGAAFPFATRHHPNRGVDTRGRRLDLQTYQNLLHNGYTFVVYDRVDIPVHVIVMVHGALYYQQYNPSC